MWGVEWVSNAAEKFRKRSESVHWSRQCNRTLVALGTAPWVELVGKEGRWKWFEYTWEVKKLENQTYTTFSRSFTEKGRRKRQLFSLPPFFPEDGVTQTNLCPGWRRVSFSRALRYRRERSSSWDLEEGWEWIWTRRGGERTGETVPAGISFLAEVRGWFPSWEWRRWLSEQGNDLYRGFSTYNGSTYDFSTLRWCKSNVHLVETILQFGIFIFSQASNIWDDILSWCWAAAESHSCLSGMRSQGWRYSAVYCVTSVFFLVQCFKDTPGCVQAFSCVR